VEHKARGELRWTLTTKLPLKNEDGVLVSLLGIARAITEHKPAEAALSRARLLLRTLIDNLPDCIFAKAAAGRKTPVNPADLQNLGCKTEAKAIGKSDFDLFSKEIAEKFCAHDFKVLQGQEVMKTHRGAGFHLRYVHVSGTKEVINRRELVKDCA